ncbi:MAG TPA: EamA family transporter [Solirubrobacteraceae bacterium]|jgi:drug/metabolite transporter (DMT)-like permease|nr:EamA family transporter [Solirubrobacteraceae bacterium]
MLAMTLALGASLCYGVSNFLGPQLVRRHQLVSVLVLSQVAALVACVLYLALEGGRALPSNDALVALLAGAGNAGGLIGFYKAAELGPLSIVAPIGASGAVVPVAWSLAHGDALSVAQGVGLTLALGGAMLVARRTGAAHHPARYPDPRAAALWAAASAVAFGVFLTALPKASAHGRAWALLDARVALVAVVAVWAGRELRGIRLAPVSALFAVPGVLLVGGTIMYTTAAAHGQLSLVSVLGSLFPIVTVGLGMGLLGERLSPPQVLGAAAALAGIVLIAL